MKKIVIYTDGGCTGNPGPGGWAYVLLDGDDILSRSGGEPATTNNRMELTAVREALEEVRRRFGEGTEVEIHTDSQYVQKGMKEWMASWIRRSWKTAAGKPVKNRALWQDLRDKAEGLRVNWHWVKGHAGHEYNEMCDRLVAREREKYA